MGVNQDVRQGIGVLRAGEAYGMDVWAHRPLVTRLLMDGLARVTPADPVVGDHALRILCSLLAIGCAAVLGHGLRRVLGATGAAFVALAVGGALVLAPTWDLAEPEWFAAAAAAAALGIACLGDRHRAGPLAAGAVLGVVGALKYTTVTTALVAVALVWMIDRMRGQWLAWTTLVSTVGVIGLTLLVAPHEWQWLRDMPLLNPTVTSALPRQLAEGWANHVLVSPMTLVALTVLTDLAVRGRVRSSAGGCAAIVVLALPFAAQHQGFLYHLAAIPVLAAGLVASGCVRGHLLHLIAGVPWTWLATALVGTGAGIAVFAAGPRTRDGLWWIGIALTVVAAVLPVVETAVARRGSSHLLPLAVAPLLLAPLLVPLSPRTAYSVSLAHSRVTSAANRAQAAEASALRERVARVVAPDAPVVHLGFTTPWQLPNPSACRYVSPTFLQRGNLSGVTGTASFAENLACLDDPTARYAVVQKDWFALEKVPPQVADAVRRNFPCAQPAYEDDIVRICARG
ncbi:hypothetical protein [Mariniluteicoccus endophyticus]